MKKKSRAELYIHMNRNAAASKIQRATRKFLAKKYVYEPNGILTVNK